MFTAGALILLGILAWLANRGNEKDRSIYDQTAEESRTWMLALHIRQDLKLVAFLLGGIMILLGAIADKLP